MKMNLLLRKMSFYGISLLLLWLPYSSYAQAVKRQCISSYGPLTACNGLLAGQTAGQSYFTLSPADNKTAVLQGFQQPVPSSNNNYAAVSPVSIGFRIFPNPVNNSFSIHSEKEINNVSVLICDINGRNIISKEIPQLTDYEITCESWDAGIYFITLYSNDRIKQTQRIIILKQK